MPLGHGKDLGFYSICDWKALEDFEGMVSSYYILKGHSGFCEEDKLSGGKKKRDKLGDCCQSSGERWWWLAVSLIAGHICLEF